jgi:hypothetical protein
MNRFTSNRPSRLARPARLGIPVVTAILLSWAAAPVFAQGEHGDPGLSGTWEASFARNGNPGARAPQADPPLKPQYMAQWRARQAAARAADARGEPLATAATFCLPQGMPAMMGGGGPFPSEILLSNGQVTIIQEAYNQVRRIYLGKPQLPLAEIEPGFYGRSVGRWDDDTLLVETIGIKESVRFRDVPHSAQMRISERIRRVEADVLWDEVTIEDPVTLEAPWQITFVLRRLPDYEMMEYVCEDNREYADSEGSTRLRIDFE